MSRRGVRMMVSALAAMLASFTSSVSPVPQHRKHDPDNKRVHDRVTSKYMPHQGDREKARRRRQMGAA